MYSSRVAKKPAGVHAPCENVNPADIAHIRRPSSARRLTDFFGHPCKQLASARWWCIVTVPVPPNPLARFTGKPRPRRYPIRSWAGHSVGLDALGSIISAVACTGDSWRRQLFSRCTVIATGVRARDRAPRRLQPKRRLQAARTYGSFERYRFNNIYEFKSAGARQSYVRCTRSAVRRGPLKELSPNLGDGKGLEHAV